MGRILGIDFGSKRIGLALSDETETIASPLTALAVGSRPPIDVIATLVKEHQVDTIVVGLPLTLRGESGPQSKQVEAFCQQLEQAVEIAVKTWDERFSTVEAQRRLREVSSKKKGRRFGETDVLAAAIMLQSYLDSLRPN